MKDKTRQSRTPWRVGAAIRLSMAACLLQGSIPSGAQTLKGTGSKSGVGLDDRTAPGQPLWQLYPSAGIFRISTGTTPTDILTIVAGGANAGNVGIGAPSPGAKLEVAGNIRVGTTAQTGSANRFRMLQSMVRVTKSADQTLSNNTATAVAWDVETFDTDGLHDNVTNNSRLTAAITGKYLVGATLVYIENQTGGRGVHVRKNGTTYYGGNEPQTPAAGGTFHDAFSHTTLVDLSAGDYVEIIGHQQSGANLDISSANNPITQAWMTYVGE